MRSRHRAGALSKAGRERGRDVAPAGSAAMTEQSTLDDSSWVQQTAGGGCMQRPAAGMGQQLA